MTTEKDKYQKIKENRDAFKSEVFFNGGYGSTPINSFLTIEEEREIRDEYKRFLDENIYTYCNLEVEYILKKSLEDRDAPFNWDDVENLNIVRTEDLINDILQEFEDEIEQKEFMKELNDTENVRVKTKGDLEVYLRNNDLESFLNDYFDYFSLDYYTYQERQEVFTWFAVSPFYCELLSKNNEVVIKDFNYFGRGTYGQSIDMDYNLQQIYLNWRLERY